MIPRVIFSILILLFLSCNVSSQSDNFGESLSVAELEAFLTTHKQTVIIDVRTPQETSSGTIMNARIIDFQSPNFESEINKLDREGDYLLYCAKGNRSAKALSLMKSKGFSKVHHLEGGYQAWQEFKK